MLDQMNVPVGCAALVVVVCSDGSRGFIVA